MPQAYTPRLSMRDRLLQGPVIGDGAMATMLHQSGLPVRTCYEEMSLVRPESVRDVHLAYIRAGADVIQTNTFGGHRLGLRRYGVEHRVREINEAAVRVAREAVDLATSHRQAGSAYQPGRITQPGPTAQPSQPSPAGQPSSAMESAPADRHEASSRPIYVFGTVGSTADLGGGDLTRSDSGRISLRQLFDEQLDILLSAGVDGIVLETFADLEEMIVALQAVRRVTSLPVLATLSPDDMDYTRDGVSLPDAFAAMRRAGADIVGLNCRLGLAGIVRAYENVKIEEHPGLYAAVPNAGLLQMEDGEYSYTGSADYFADMGAKLFDQGIRFIGGCCGTTPNHIRKLAQRLRGGVLDGAGVSGGSSGSGASGGPGVSDSPGGQGVSVRQGSVAGTVGQADSGEVAAAGVREAYEAGPTVVDESLGGATASRDAGTTAVHHSPVTIDIVASAGNDAHAPIFSPLLDKVRSQTTIIAELDPPRTTDISRYLAGARALHEAGVDAITLADNSLGTVRVSNMALASLLKPMGIEPLVHVACRDRNLIGQQSHLMGLHVLGIHHILLVTGDPSRFGDLPGATSVYDVSSIDLTKMVRKLNEGYAFSGRALKQPARFVVGTSFNPHVRNFDKAIDRLRRKLDAGADYVMTQPVYDVRMMEAIERATREFDVPVFIGIMPLVSARNALYIHNEVPGIEVPEGILSQMVNADEQQVAEVGLDIAKGLAALASEYFNGIYLVTPFLRYDLTVSLVNHLRG